MCQDFLTHSVRKREVLPKLKDSFDKYIMENSYQEILFNLCNLSLRLQLSFLCACLKTDRLLRYSIFRYRKFNDISKGNNVIENQKVFLGVINICTN
jgi:hypothetical protein